MAYILEELQSLLELYNISNSKVAVNYIRRFIPAYGNLKLFIEQLLLNEDLTNIVIRYQRGFLNNCSHALDLLQYLVGGPIKLENLIKGNIVNDHFDNDPTISAIAKWNNINISMVGLAHVLFSHFEIDLYFKYYRIAIKDAGNSIEIFKADIGEGFLNPLKIQDHLCSYNCLNNYMLHISDHAYKLLHQEETRDNFAEAVHLNKSLLEYINI